MRSAGCILVFVACGGAVAPAGAQVSDGRFRALDQGYEDVAPNAESHRVFQLVDLRVPYGFEGVFEIQDAPGLLARRSGAVTAVFERSVYNEDASAAIPAGTVFYLGDLPVDLGQPGVLSRRPALGARGIDSAASSRVQTEIASLPYPMWASGRIDLRVPSEAPGADASPESSIWNSEQYRRRRVGEILRKAAGAGS